MQLARRSKEKPCNTPFLKHPHSQTTTAPSLQTLRCTPSTSPGCPQMVFSEPPSMRPELLAIQLPALVPPPNSKRGCQRG